MSLASKAKSVAYITGPLDNMTTESVPTPNSVKFSNDQLHYKHLSGHARSTKHLKSSLFSDPAGGHLDSVWPFLVHCIYSYRTKRYSSSIHSPNPKHLSTLHVSTEQLLSSMAPRWAEITVCHHAWLTPNSYTSSPNLSWGLPGLQHCKKQTQFFSFTENLERIPILYNQFISVY